MITCILVCFDNKLNKFVNFEFINVTRSEAVQKFKESTPSDLALINIIEL
jgi:hypothetical protein